MAAITAAQNGAEVTLLEKNEKIGKKLFITGKGRCNITNAAAPAQFLEQVVTNPKFLLSAINKFSSVDTIKFFEDAGLKLKTERGGRVFPESDKSSDILKCFESLLKKYKVNLKLNTKVAGIEQTEGAHSVPAGRNSATGKFMVKINSKGENPSASLVCDKLIIATGGKSYPSTGSTGDGYNFASALGHSLAPFSPGLVPMDLKNYDGGLAGLSLKNVEASVIEGAIEPATINLTSKFPSKIEGWQPQADGVCDGAAGISSATGASMCLNRKKQGPAVHKEFGELLFTHTGVSGPVILTLSSLINKLNLNEAVLSIDLKPALSIKQLDARLLRDFENYKNKNLSNYLPELLPKGLIDEFCKKADLDKNKKINAITKAERANLIYILKNFRYNIKQLRSLDEAIITSGGINTRDINPNTMESKIIKGLYFAGEIIDVDALTGGFNMQIALSTGYVAGQSATVTG